MKTSFYLSKISLQVDMKTALWENIWGKDKIRQFTERSPLANQHEKILNTEYGTQGNTKLNSHCSTPIHKAWKKYINAGGHVKKHVLIHYL